MMILRAAFAAAAVLSLVSCGVLQYIFGSVFPATTMLAKAQADLSGSITRSDANAFQVRVVETAGYGYVVVTGNPPSGPEAFVYDLDLNQKAVFNSASGLTADGVMVDVNGNIAIGNLLRNPSDLSSVATVTAATLGTNASSGEDGFADSSGPSNLFGFFINSNVMSWSISSGAWGTPTSPATPPSISVKLSGLSMYAVFDDGNPSGGSVYFVIGPSFSNGQVGTVYFFSVPKTGFAVPINILDSSPSRDNLELESFGYANGSIFAYDSNAASFVKINPSDGSIEKSFYSATDAKDTRFAYRVGGGSFYGFDTQSRILTKYGAWWP